jgi:hypothetical protein
MHMVIRSVNGYNIIVDDDCDKSIFDCTWYITAHGYARCMQENKTGYHFLHHMIMGFRTSEVMTIDHINMNKLDNRKCNLRHVSKSLNQVNRDKRSGNYKSTFKGVSSLGKYWRAYININKKRHELGSYASEVDAARAYNLFVIKNIGNNYALNRTGDNYKLFTPIPKRRKYNNKHDFISF